MLTAQFQDITPELAKRYLDLNKNNYRKMSNTVVQKYAADMIAGRWELNGEAIQFDQRGYLINGQHRLAAIVKANIPIRMLVVRGVESSVFDIGKGRSFVQIARANGRISSTTTGAAIDIVANGFTRNHPLSPMGIYEYYINHDPNLFDEITRFACRGGHGTVSMIAKKGPVVAALYCAVKLGIAKKHTVESFCRVLNTGVAEENEIGNAAQVLRRQLVTARYKDPTGRTYIQTTFENTWQALNGFKNKEPRKRDYKPDGSGEEILEKIREINK